MKRVRLLLPLAAFVAIGTLRADPYTGYCYPAGLQAGTTNRFVIGGQRLWQIQGGWVSGDGVRVLKVEQVRNFPVPNGLNQGKWLHTWMHAILDGKREMPPFGVSDRDLAGWSRHPWWETMGSLPPLEFSMVAHNLLTPRNALQMSPALSERLIVTIAAAPNATPGVRDLVLFDPRGTSAPRPFLISSERHVPEPLFAPPHKPNAPKQKSANKRKAAAASLPRPNKGNPAALRLPVVLDGQIMPGETDVFTLALDKGPVSFLLTGRELQPYLGDAVPGFFNAVLRLTDDKGRELAFADDFSYLPDPILTADIPTPGTYRLEVRDNLFRGRDDFVYAITCRTGKPAASIRARALACYPPPASHDAAGITGSACQAGTVAKPGQTSRHAFTVREPGDWEFDLFARRQGSPLDGVLRLYGPCSTNDTKNPPLLATWDDTTNGVLVGSIPQTTCDPTGRWHFDHAGDYVLTVGDRIGAGGDAYRYTLCLAPAQPTFDVYTTKSSVLFHRGRRDNAQIKVRVVRRNGFTGAITLEDTADLRFDRATIPADKDEATVVCSPIRRNWEGPRRLNLTAWAKTKTGATLRRPVVTADEAEQAFAYTHLLPSRGLSLTMFRANRDEIPFPTWPEMPRDTFLPPRILRTNEASFAAIPVNFNDSVLRTRFTAPVTFARDQTSRAETYAFEPTSHESSSLLARTVLGGISRFVSRDCAYADGDARRVRFLARAAMLRPDNDVLYFVPNALTNDFSGSVWKTALHLYRAGYSFDVASEALLQRTPFVKRHRVIFVPQLDTELSADVTNRLAECEKLLKVPVVYERDNAKPKKKKLHELARREQLPKGVRFMRLWDRGPDTWYFVYNTSPATVTGPWRFSARGQANHAVAMDPDNGKIVELKSAGRNAFSYTLEHGAAAWILVTPRPLQTSR